MRRLLIGLTALATVGVLIATLRPHRTASQPSPPIAPNATVTTTTPSTAVPAPSGASTAARHDAAGAVATVIGWEQRSAQLVNATEAVVAAAQADMSAEATRADLVEVNRAKARQLRLVYPQGGIVDRVVVLDTRATARTPDAIDVEVWRLCVVAYPDGQTAQDWAIVQYQLVWERDAWRILTETTTPGPVPVANVAVTPAADLRTRLTGFQPIGSPA